MTGLPFSQPLKNGPAGAWRKVGRAIGLRRLAAHQVGLLAVLAIYLGLVFGYREAVPPTLAPDEQGHVQFIKDLAHYRELPVYSFPRSAEAHQPPLYYLIGTVLVNVFPIEGFAAHRATVADEQRGYRLVRLLSIGFGLATVILFYRLARVAFPDRPRLGPIAAAFGGLLPQQVFLTSTVNNDNAATAFGTLLLIILVAMMRAPAVTARHALFFGAVLGIATLMKESMLTFLPIGVAVTLIKGGSRRGRIGLVALIGLPVAACVLPYALRNYSLYHSFLTSTNALFHLPTNAGSPPEWRDGRFPSRWFVTVFPGALFTSFWGALSWTNLRLETFYPIFLGLTVASLIGLGLAVRDARRRGATPRNDPDLAVIALLGAVAVVFCLSIVSYNTRALSPQGRHIFPALGAFVILGSLGIDTLARRSRRIRPAVWPAAIALILIGANLSGITLFALGEGRLGDPQPVPIETGVHEARFITVRPAETLLPTTELLFETKQGLAGVWRWKVAPAADWLSVRAVRSTDRQIALRLIVDPSELSIGDYETTLTVEGDGVAVQGRSIPIRLAIVEPRLVFPLAGRGGAVPGAEDDPAPAAGSATGDNPAGEAAGEAAE